MKKKCICLLLLFTCITGLQYANAQIKLIDSVRRLIAAAQTGSQKIEHIYQLCNLAINSDSLLPYVIMAEQISKQTNNKLDADKANITRASYYVRKNYIDSALALVDPIITAYKTDKNRQDYYINLLLLKSKILDRGNRYIPALTQLYKAVETAQALNDTLILIQAQTGIGWVQMEMEQYNEALKWLYKALNTSSNKTFYKNYGALYSNIASTYNSLGKADSARLYIDIAIKNARESNNMVFLATALSMQAKIFIDSKQPYLAEAPLHETVAIRKELNDPFYTVYDMSSLASYYATNNQTSKGIALCMEGIGLAKQSGLSSQLLMMYRSLAENYKAAGNTAAYSHTLEDIIALKDSFNNINSAKQIAEMEATNAAQKNEKTIIEQKLNLTIKNYWLFGSALFGLLVATIIWLAFKNYNRKQNLKMQLAVDEEKRNAAQSVIAAEEQERRRIAADLHDNIGAYASAIRADVENIALSSNNKNHTALQNLQQHSQEIISSLRDTIWVLNKEHITITGISDRIKTYINKLQPSYSTIIISLQENIITDMRMSSQQALNIFRIVQEAIHNALKHSNAKNIIITIESKKNVVIKIADDGSGIAATAVGGNGLQNMKHRAAESGLQLMIDTAFEKGTTLTLQSATTN